ncbi:MAG: 3-dehydroquinate synthase [Bacillota bacterium]
MKTVNVNTSKPYDILIGEGHLSTIGEEMKKVHKPCKVAIITDTIVNPLYGEIVKKSIESAGFEVVVYEFLAGEISKTMELVGNICEFLAEEELTRSDLIVALGGGVVGDISGFVSAIYLRGISFVQIPTTLLAAVDSSVGGKTGADLRAGKNLVGAFLQPILVLCDIKTLDTLPETTFAEGVAEIIKYGVLGNQELFYQLENGLDKNELADIIETCVSMKRDVVLEDEFDNGKRQLLNLGHTLGHSIEQLSNFTIPHGYGVSMGMYLITKIAEDMGIARCGLSDDIKKVLQKNHLPVEISYAPDAIAKGSMKDKKRRGGSISFVFPEEIGSCIIQKIEVDKVKNLIVEAMNRG